MTQLESKMTTVKESKNSVTVRTPKHAETSELPNGSAKPGPSEHTELIQPQNDTFMVKLQTLWAELIKKLEDPVVSHA